MEDLSEVLKSCMDSLGVLKASGAIVRLPDNSIASFVNQRITKSEELEDRVTIGLTVVPFRDEDVTELAAVHGMDVAQFRNDYAIPIPTEYSHGGQTFPIEVVRLSHADRSYIYKRIQHSELRAAVEAFQQKYNILTEPFISNNGNVGKIYAVSGFPSLGGPILSVAVNYLSSPHSSAQIRDSATIPSSFEYHGITYRVVINPKNTGHLGP